MKSIKQDETKIENVSCTGKEKIEDNELKIAVTLYPEVERDISEENKFGTPSTNLWIQNENRNLIQREEEKIEQNLDESEWKQSISKWKKER